MTVKTKISSQGRTVIPAEIGKKLGIREGEEVEWTLQGELIVARLIREEKTPDEIIEYIKNHLVEIRHVPHRVVPTGVKRRMMNEWVRKKLGRTP